MICGAKDPSDTQTRIPEFIEHRWIEDLCGSANRKHGRFLKPVECKAKRSDPVWSPVIVTE